MYNRNAGSSLDLNPNMTIAEIQARFFDKIVETLVTPKGGILVFFENSSYRYIPSNDFKEHQESKRKAVSVKHKPINARQHYILVKNLLKILYRHGFVKANGIREYIITDIPEVPFDNCSCPVCIGNKSNAAQIIDLTLQMGSSMESN